VIHPSKVLASLQLRALKSFGQNFLVSQSSLVGLEKHFDVEKPLLEIGPGLGAITEYLLDKNFNVAVVEKDPLMANYLQERFKQRLKVHNRDFLELESEFFKENNISQVIGNLPFYITSDIITRLINESGVEVFVIGIQKEVGQRLLKARGNSLALFVKASGDIVEHRVIGKNNFYPVPDVDAIWITWKRNRKIEDIKMFEVFLRGVFWGKRKNLSSVLLKNPFFEKFPETENWRKNVLTMQEELVKLHADQMSFEELKDVFLKIIG